MKTKVSHVADVLINFIDNADDDLLSREAVVLTNGTWNIHLDYQGSDPKAALEDLRIFATHKTNLIKDILGSQSARAIIYAAQNLTDFFDPRQFTVSVAARNNFMLGLELRARVWFSSFFNAT